MFWVCGTSFDPHLPLCFHCNLTTKKKSTNKNISDTKKETLSVMVFTFSSFIGFSNLNPTSREATIHSSIHILGTRCAVQIKNYLAAESLNFRTPTSEKEPWPQIFGGWGEGEQSPDRSQVSRIQFKGSYPCWSLTCCPGPATWLKPPRYVTCESWHFIQRAKLDRSTLAGLWCFPGSLCIF